MQNLRTDGETTEEASKDALTDRVRELELKIARYEAALNEIAKMPHAAAIARGALHPIDVEEFKRRLGPTVAEQLAALENGA